LSKYIVNINLFDFLNVETTRQLNKKNYILLLGRVLFDSRGKEPVRSFYILGKVRKVVGAYYDAHPWGGGQSPYMVTLPFVREVEDVAGSFSGPASLGGG
jgi:hypothetical protein